MKNLPRLPFKPLDFAAIGLSVFLTAASGVLIYARPANTFNVVIQGPGRSWVFPRDAEETVSVPGPLGVTIVRIHGGSAWVENSPCDNSTCVATGHIHEQGQWIACLPNNVFVLIEGKETSGIPDASTW